MSKLTNLLLFRQLQLQDPYYKNSQNRADQLVKKWEPTTLLEGMDVYEARNAALVYENQISNIIAESTLTGNSSNSLAWAGIALPLVRKLLADIPARQFMSIQPLDRPIGQVYYLDFKYGNTKAPYALGESIYGTTLGVDDPTGGFYGAGRFSYSVNTHNASIASGSITVGTATLKDLNFIGTISTASVKKITITPDSSWMIDQNAVRSFALLITSASVSSIDKYYPALTTLNTDGTITFIVVPANGVTLNNTGFNYKIYYSVQPNNAWSRGDFLFRENSTMVIPLLDVSFTNKFVAAKTRKLKAVWTPLSQQDMKSLQNFDFEALIVNMLSEQITKEIDIELLLMMLVNADTVDYWSAQPGYDYDKSSNSFKYNPTYLINDKSIWFRNLGIKLNQVSNIIYQKTLRGLANFAVVSPRVGGLIQSMPGYMSHTSGNTTTVGTQKVGTLDNMLTIHKCPYITDNVILLGYKGNSYLESGAVYSPYVPLIQTPVLYDYDKMVPRKGISTRYAKTITRRLFFGKIYIQGMETL